VYVASSCPIPLPPSHPWTSPSITHRRRSLFSLSPSTHSHRLPVQAAQDQMHTQRPRYTLPMHEVHQPGTDVRVSALPSFLSLARKTCPIEGGSGWRSGGDD